MRVVGITGLRMSLVQEFVSDFWEGYYSLDASVRIVTYGSLQSFVLYCFDTVLICGWGSTLSYVKIENYSHLKSYPWSCQEEKMLFFLRKECLELWESCKLGSD